MKSTQLLCLLFLVAINSFAQETKTSLPADASKRKSSLSLQFGNAPWDFKVGWYEIDSESLDGYDVKQIAYSVGVKYQRIIKENVAFRLRGTYMKIHLHEYNGFSDARTKQTKFQLAPGFTFSLDQKKFSLYGGFELPVYYHGEVTSTFDGSYKVVIPSGLTVGIAPLIGFSYDFGQRFFCESEFSLQCLYGKTGGQIETVTNGVSTPSSHDALQGFFYEPRIALGVGFRL